jgi:hypothetical protein
VAAIDIRKLRPPDLCRLLNSTPLGEVIGEREIYRHRTRVGFRIGDGRHIDLFRYAAWLLEVRHTPRPPGDADPYATLKKRSRARNAALSLAQLPHPLYFFPVFSGVARIFQSLQVAIGGVIQVRRERMISSGTFSKR